MLVSFLSWEFLLHIPCWLHFYLGSFSYTSHAGFIFLWGFLLDIPCWLHFYLGSFSYTTRAGFNFMRAVSSTHTMLTVFIGWVSLTHPLLSWFVSKKFPIHIPCWLRFYLGSFSYTSHAGFIFLWGFLLDIPCWLHFYLGSFSYTTRAGFNFMRAVSSTHTMLTVFIGWVSLTHPLLSWFVSKKFLWHNPCWLPFYLGSFSYTSHAGVNLIWGVCLTHPTLASFLCRELLLHIPCWL